MDREAAHQEKIERKQKQRWQGTADASWLDRGLPRATERPSASVKNNSIAVRSAVQPCSRRSSAGSAGSRPCEDLLLDAASGDVPDVSRRSGNWLAAAIAFTALGRGEALGWRPALDNLLADHPRSWGWLSPSSSAFWSELAKTIRLWADYLRWRAAVRPGAEA